MNTLKQGGAIARVSTLFFLFSAVAVLASGVAAPGAQAQIAKQGTVEWTSYATGVPKSYAFGENQIVVTEITAVSVNSKGGGLFHNWAQSFVAVRDSRAQTLFFYGALTDQDGDQVFIRGERAAIPGQTGSGGRGQFIGGTGKYQGIRGDFTYSVTSVPAAEPGKIRYISPANGRYELP